eukprot:TRINITY_DN822_c0_g1_i2.p1 TRINITY_DN822_c0_g1~~TRINITY_DN822_c0_g1_i2.p1  ORF type:complete len:198 (-),score=33.63 TRINITY_DN822_c0_g1_i2:210-758(-)
MTTWKQAATAFDEESAGWDNGGPTLHLMNGNTTVRVDPSGIRSSGWKQLWGAALLSKKQSSDPNDPDNKYEFTLQIDSLRHNEIVLGVVDPNLAPKTPLCLHSCRAEQGVYIHFFGFSAIKQEDFLTALIDLNNNTLSFARNGTVVSTIETITIPDTVVPVVELYHHEKPVVSLIQLPFLDE